MTKAEWSNTSRSADGRWPGRMRAPATRRVSRGYLGKNDTFDDAIGEFAVAYADQTERDHAALVKAIRAGTARVRAEAVVGIIHKSSGRGLFPVIRRAERS